MSYQEAKVAFHEFYSQNDSFLKSGESFFRSLTESIIADSDVKVHHVSSRVKTRESCLDKFDKKYRSKFEQEGDEYQIKDHISDLIGVRIVCFLRARRARHCRHIRENIGSR
jgi:putative GTP pyrophosphokinase